MGFLPRVDGFIRHTLSPSIPPPRVTKVRLKNLSSPRLSLSLARMGGIVGLEMRLTNQNRVDSLAYHAFLPQDFILPRKDLPGEPPTSDSVFPYFFEA